MSSTTVAIENAAATSRPERALSDDDSRSGISRPTTRCGTERPRGQARDHAAVDAARESDDDAAAAQSMEHLIAHRSSRRDARPRPRRSSSTDDKIERGAGALMSRRPSLRDRRSA